MSEHWQVFAALMAVVAAWSLIIITSLRIMFSRWVKETEEKIAAFNKTSQTLERELLELKADLPVQYVRREDHLRDSATIYIKIDRMSEKFEVKFDEIRQEIINLHQKKTGVSDGL